MSRHSLLAHSFFSFSVFLLVCFFTWLVVTPFHESLTAKLPQLSSLGVKIGPLWTVITFWAAKTFGLFVPMSVHSFNVPTDTIPADWTYVTIPSLSRGHATYLGNMRHSFSIICSQKGCYSDDASSRTLNGHSVSISSNTPSRCLNSCSSLGYIYGGVKDGRHSPPPPSSVYVNLSCEGSLI